MPHGTNPTHSSSVPLSSGDTRARTGRNDAVCGWGKRTRASRECIAALWTIAALLVTGVLVLGASCTMTRVSHAWTPNPWAKLSILSAPALPVLDSDEFIKGRANYMATCATCHSVQGTGVNGLGKDLTRSEFVCELTDAGLVSFMKKGREANDPLNTTRVPMPPRGGNPNFSDADLQAVAVYMRGLQDPRRVPNVPAYEPPAPRSTVPTEAEKAAALAAAGGDAELAEWIAHGATLFAASCSSCHGADAKGMPGLGRTLIGSEFVNSLNDDDLLDFLLKGRSPSDPASVTKIQMPPKGGNPALSDNDLLDIIAFIRSLQKPAGTATP